MVAPPRDAEIRSSKGAAPTPAAPTGRQSVILTSLPSPSLPAHRVFLFVDPELVSASVCSALLLEIQAAQVQQSPEACMRHVVAHALQAALGEACHVAALHQKLQVTDARPPEPCNFLPTTHTAPPPAVSCHLHCPSQKLILLVSV